ncbi:MAG: hypothetical protein IJ396_03085 [Oscillibacter sp.]|nr:hypothetical protein [Oscillibacter sp.]
MEERTRFQNVILIVLAAMVVIFGVLTGVVRSQKGVQFGDSLLWVEETEEATVYTGKVHGDNVTVSVSGNAFPDVEVAYTVEGGRHDVYTVEYPLEPVETEYGPVPGIRILKNQTIIFRGAYDPDGEIRRWYDGDGEWTFVVTGPPDVHDLTRGNLVYFANGPELTSRGSWGLYLLLVLITAVLAFDVWYPEALFYLQHSCDVRDPEPSDFYIATQRISWVVYTCALLCGHIYILTHIW